jgi:hypothetical protein
MMKNLSELESMIQKRLDELKSVPPRNPKTAARARARFLAQAVAASEARRNTGWGFIFRQRQFAMNMVMALLVIAGLFAGGATTVQAAQDDLPNEPLYIVKTWSEDVSLQFENDPEAKADRLMELAQTRVQEITLLVEAGQTPPRHVELRLEQHLEQTFQLYSRMDDASLEQGLLQLRDQLQQQDHAMQNLQTHATQNAQPILESTRLLLETHLQVVDDGLLDHEVFRNSVQNGVRHGQTETPPTSAPSVTAAPHGEQNGQATPQTDNPGNGNGVGPNPHPGMPDDEATLTPGNNGNDPNSGNNKDKNKDKGPKDENPGKKGSNSKDPK